MVRFSIILCTFLITACGGGGSSDSSGDDINLEDILGTFQVILDDEPFDESYTIVKDNGTYTDYDFQGDSVDNGDNCYIITGGELRDIGTSEFALLDDSGFDAKVRLSRQEFGFRATYYEVLGNPEDIKATFQRSDLLESDFNECPN